MAMPGGLFLISSKWFRHIGEFDSGMELWGGENVDLSLRTWLCGGRLIMCPCSHIGHVFRKAAPYKFPYGVQEGNKRRVAEVWLDEYKKYFYAESFMVQVKRFYTFLMFTTSSMSKLVFDCLT